MTDNEGLRKTKNLLCVTVLDDHALEPLRPQRPEALMPPVEPLAEPLLELFHEHGHVPHPPDQSLADILVDLPSLRHRLPHQQGQRPLAPIVRLHPLEQLGVGERGWLGNPDQQMEMIGHHAVSDDLNPAEPGQFSQHPHEPLLLEVSKHTGTRN